MAKKFIALIYTTLFLLASCSTEGNFKSCDGLVWNTTYHIVYDCNRDLTDSILNVLNDVTNSLSAFDSLSVVSRINRNESVVVDRHFKEVFHKSIEVNNKSCGAFDPTLSPLINAWGFGFEYHQADTLRLDSIAAFVGIEKCRIEGDRLVKDDSRLHFNFSAIAKGYGCDAVAAMMKRNGVANYMVEIGGEVVAYGVSPRGDLWRVGVLTPSKDIDDNPTAKLVVELKDMAIATSGNYRNYKEQGGKIVGHTISPTTYRPVQRDVVSATVLASTCMEADAYATACMVLGSKDSKDMAEKNRLAIYLILDGDSVWVSPAMRDLIERE